MKSRYHPLSVGIQVCLSTLLSAWMSAHAALNDGLELYYPFDSNGGGVAVDASGKGRNGTVYNAQWRSGGPQGGYTYMDGSGDYINAGTAVNFPAWTQFSISVWFLNDGGGDNTGYGQKLIDKTSFMHDAHVRIAPNHEAVGTIWYQVYEGGNGLSVGTASKRVRGDGQWHHFAVIRDGTNSYAWLDGAQVAAGRMISVNSSSPLYIGYSAATDSAQKRYWSGYVDEVRIYNRAISVQEVAELAGAAPCQLSVASAAGSPVPAVGLHSVKPASNVTAQVASPVLDGAATRHVCTGWTGSGDVPASGTTNWLSFVVSTNSAIAWQWRTEHFLAVEADAGGTASGSGWYAAGNSVLIEAAAAPGFAFVDWSDGSAEPSRYVTVAAGALAYRAQFAAVPCVLTVTGNPVECGTPAPAGYGAHNVAYGTVVSNGVPAVVSNGTDTRYLSLGWNGTGCAPASGAANSVAFAITNASTVAWQWRTEHRLVVEADAGGTASGGGWHVAGSSVLIEAAADAGFAFVGWSDGSSEPSRYVTVSAGALSYRALFSATAELHVLSPAGEPAPSRGIHRVTVGARVDARVPASYTFGSTRQVCSGWLGTGSVPPSGPSNSVSFTLARDSSIAWYWASEALLNLQPGDGGAVIGGGWYAPGSFVSVLATPNLGYRFAGWSDGSAEAARWILVPALGATYSARFQVAPIDTVRFRQGAVSVDESTGEVFLTLERIGAARTAAAVTCKPRPGSARAVSDFTAAGVKVTWAAGDATEKRIRIRIVADKVAEPAETFTVELLNPSALIFGEPRVATVTILSQLPVLTGTQPLSVGVLDRGGEQ